MNEISSQVEMFLNIAALTKSDQEKVQSFVQKLGIGKKTSIKKSNFHPKAGFMKGAFQSPVLSPEPESLNGDDNISDNQTEL